MRSTPAQNCAVHAFCIPESESIYQPCSGVELVLPDRLTVSAIHLLIDGCDPYSTTAALHAPEPLLFHLKLKSPDTCAVDLRRLLRMHSSVAQNPRYYSTDTIEKFTRFPGSLYYDAPR